MIFPEKATSTGIFSRLFWTLQTFKRTRWIFLHLQSSRYASHMYRKLRRVGEKFYIHVEVICLGLCYMYKLENNIFFFFFRFNKSVKGETSTTASKYLINFWIFWVNFSRKTNTLKTCRVFKHLKCVFLFIIINCRSKLKE